MSRREVERLNQRLEHVESELAEARAFIADLALVYPAILVGKPPMVPGGIYINWDGPLGDYRHRAVKAAAQAVRAERQASEGRVELAELRGEKPKGAVNFASKEQADAYIASMSAGRDAANPPKDAS